MPDHVMHVQQQRGKAASQLAHKFGLSTSHAERADQRQPCLSAPPLRLPSVWTTTL